MESSDNQNPQKGDYSAAVPLEISGDVAAAADDLLREFAEDAGLDTALVVDRSGALVAGISAEAEVTIEVISALVAGASGAMRALVAQLGETGALESLHLGGDRMIYLREIVNRFILVGVAEASRPAGLVRQKAYPIAAALSDLLKVVTPGVSHLPPEDSGPAVRSLRDIANRRAAERVATVSALVEEVEEVEEVVPRDEWVRDGGGLDGTGEAPLPEPIIYDSELGTSGQTDAPEEVISPALPPAPPAPSVEPREVLEPLDFGEAEIVIEETRYPRPSSLPPKVIPIDSPFESEEDEEETPDSVNEGGSVFVKSSPSGSVFELEESDGEEEGRAGEDEEIIESSGDGPETARPPVPIEIPANDIAVAGLETQNIFEMDEFDEESDRLEESKDPDIVANHEAEDMAEVFEEMIDAGDEESEVRSSGPFYF